MAANEGIRSTHQLIKSVVLGAGLLRFIPMNEPSLMLSIVFVIHFFYFPDLSFHLLTSQFVRIPLNMIAKSTLRSIALAALVQCSSVSAFMVRPVPTRESTRLFLEDWVAELIGT
jgi:hypothetical protein